MRGKGGRRYRYRPRLNTPGRMKLLEKCLKTVPVTMRGMRRLTERKAKALYWVRQLKDVDELDAYLMFNLLCLCDETTGEMEMESNELTRMFGIGANIWLELDRLQKLALLDWSDWIQWTASGPYHMVRIRIVPLTPIEE